MSNLKRGPTLANTEKRERGTMSHTHPLLMTKLAMPAAQPWLVSRSRLLAHLAEARSRLTLLCAPAGFGKSAPLTPLSPTSPPPSPPPPTPPLFLYHAH